MNAKIPETTLIGKPSKQKKDPSHYYYLLLILSPLLSLFPAIMNYRRKESRAIVFTLLGLFGFTLVYSSKGIDAAREAETFNEWAMSSFDSILVYFYNLYSTSEKVDFFGPLVMFIVSRFTANPSFYFCIIALIFGFFQLKSINHIYDNFFAYNWNAIVHFLFFIFILPVFYISGSRWALAAWVYFYGIYHYFNYHQNKYLIFTAFSIFIHFSFFGSVALFLGYLVVGRRNNIYYALIIASFIIAPYMTRFLSGYETDTFVGVKDRVLLYANNEAKELNEGALATSRWFMRIQLDIIMIYISLAVLYTRNYFRSISKDRFMEIIYSFALLLFAYANTLSKVPSGDRFRLIFLLFATFYLIMFYSKLGLKKLHFTTILGLVPICIYVAIEIRRGLELVNIFLLTPLPIPFVFSYSLF